MRILLQKLSGKSIVKLGTMATDPDVPFEDTRLLARAIAAETSSRGWPDGWYEDPSVLSDEQMSGRRL